MHVLVGLFVYPFNAKYVQHFTEKMRDFDE